MKAELFFLWTAVAVASGWRGDGDGQWPGTSPPTAWTEAWSAPLGGWSNASPAVDGDLACVQQEPTTLVCVDAASGAPRWAHAHPVLDSLAEADRAAVAGLVAAGEQAAIDLEDVRARYSRALRAARSSGGDGGEVEVLSRQLDQIKASLEASARYRTPADKDLIGWSSPTPLVASDGVWAFFGNGVVVARARDGGERWSRWLGEPAERMWGWDWGTAASPVRVGELVVVGHRDLVALDANSGAERWRVPDWRHFGAPAVVDPAGAALLVAPDGRVVRAADGVVVARGLGEAWYLSPAVSGREVYLVEARSGQMTKERGSTTLKAWTLGPLAGDKLEATPRYTVHIPSKEPIYGTPVVHDGRLYLVTANTTLMVLDAATGAVLHQQKLTTASGATSYAGPGVAGEHLFVGVDDGRTFVLTLGDAPAIVAENAGPPRRSSLTFVGSSIFLRADDRLQRLH